MYNTSSLSINELRLLGRNLDSEQTDRGGGGLEVYSCEKLDESPSRENFHKRLSLANPRLANALNWCKKRKLERDNVRVSVKGRK